MSLGFRTVGFVRGLIVKSVFLIIFLGLLLAASFVLPPAFFERVYPVSGPENPEPDYREFSVTVGPGGNFSTISEALASSPENYAVIVLPGTYRENLRISGRVVLGFNATVLPENPYLPGIEITGTGRVSGLRLVFSNGTGSWVRGTSFVGLYVHDASDVRLEELEIEGYPTGVIVNRSSGVSLDRVRVRGTEWNGLLALDSSVSVGDSVFTGSEKAHGVALLNSSGKFRNVSSFGNHGYGFYLENVRSAVFRSVSAFSNTFGFFIQDSAGNEILLSNLSFNRAENVRMENSSGNRISSSYIGYSETENGIYLNESHGNSFVNLTVERNRWNGFHFNNSRLNSVSDSVIRGNEPAGVYLFNSPRTVITGSKLTENRWRGVFSVGSPGLVLENSEVVKNLEGVYLENSENSSVTGNLIGDNPLYGVRIESSDRVRVTGNEIFGSRQNEWAAAVAVSSSKGVEVVGNILYSNSAPSDIKDSEVIWRDNGSGP